MGYSRTDILQGRSQDFMGGVSIDKAGTEGDADELWTFKVNALITKTIQNLLKGGSVGKLIEQLFCCGVDIFSYRVELYTAQGPYILPVLLFTRTNVTL